MNTRGKRSERGAATVEYALIVGLCAIILLGALQFLTAKVIGEWPNRPNCTLQTENGPVEAIC